MTTLRGIPSIQVQVTGARGALGIDLDGTPTPGEFLVKAPGGSRAYQTASGTGADAGLRTDLAAPSGTGLIGFKPVGSGTTRSLQAKASDFVNVADFGALGDGVTDDYPAFAAAFAACANGGTIYVSKPTVGYYLSANPDPYSTQTYGTIPHTFRAKNVNWRIDSGSTFSGPGTGTPTGLGPQFLSQLTNPYNQTFGPMLQIDLTKNVTLNGSALIAESTELAEDFGYAVTLTGDLTNGSSNITNVAVTGGGSLSQLKTGDRIVSTTAGWPTGPFNRVWSVSGNTIAFGIDAGAGPASAGPAWAGATTTGVSFTVYKKAWYALKYRGLNTGGPASIDMAYGICNDVINLTGGPANAYEIDLIALADPGTFSRAIFMTGHGDASATLTALDIQRAGPTPWAAAVAVRGATTALFANAKNPLSLDAVYLNGATGLPEPVNFGLHMNNAPAIRGAVVEASQITDGSQAIVIWRYTDTNPNALGRAFQFMNAANTSELMFVDIFGAIQTYAPATSGGSTVGAGGIMTNGLTLRGGTNLQLGQTRTAGTPTNNGYVTVYGSDGQPIKLATVA